MKHVLIDGFCFQVGQDAVSGIVNSIIPQLEKEGVAITVLDRGYATGNNFGRIIPFPAWTGVGSAADALLVQKFCDNFGADVILTTGVASAVRSPSVLLTSGFIGANSWAFPMARLRDEYELALRHARKIVCLSASAREEIIEICIDLVEEEPSHLSIELPAPDDVPATLMAALRSSACASNSRVYRDFARDWTALRTIQAEVDLEVYANA